MDSGITLSSSDSAMAPKKNKTAVPCLQSKWKNIVYLLKQRMTHCLRLGKKNCVCTEAIKGHAEPCIGQNFSPETWVWSGAHWYSLWLICFEIGYCGHPAFPYALIHLQQATKLIPEHFQEEDHTLIYDTLNKNRTQLVWLYFVYRPKKNASRTDITNDDQKSYAFAPTYGDVSTAFHHNMISVVLFS